MGVVHWDSASLAIFGGFVRLSDVDMPCFVPEIHFRLKISPSVMKQEDTLRASQEGIKFPVSPTW